MKRIFLFSTALFIAVFSLQAQDYNQVYLIGGATANGWDNQRPQIMNRMQLTATDAIYEWTGNLRSSDFKFINAIGSWVSFNALTANEKVVMGQIHGLTFNTANDHKFTIDAGRYTVTVNLKKMTMVVVPASVAFPDLWITGSAVSETTKLVAKPGDLPGVFTYTGLLQPGDFKLTTTATIGNATQYFVPLVSFESVGGVSEFQQTSNATLSGWTVCDNGVSKIKIDPDAKTITASLFTSPGQLYIVGGCTAVGWAADKAIALQQDTQDPNLFIFDGELKHNPASTDNGFRFLGQLDWGPIVFGSFSANEYVIGAQYVFPGASVNFAIDKNQQGHYIIKVNTLFETIEAKFDDGTGIKEPIANGDYQCLAKNRCVEIIPAGNEIIKTAVLFDITGKIRAVRQNQTGRFVLGKGLPAGIYLVKITDNAQTTVKKVLIN